jgi:hypothetical protein
MSTHDGFDFRSFTEISLLDVKISRTNSCESRVLEVEKSELSRCMATIVTAAAALEGFEHHLAPVAERGPLGEIADA